jgi:hypothetical protein
MNPWMAPGHVSLRPAYGTVVTAENTQIDSATLARRWRKRSGNITPCRWSALESLTAIAK